MDNNNGGNLRINKNHFDINTLDDEIRADSLCQEILKDFYLDLVGKGMEEEEASDFAKSADYFLRDFVISAKQANIFQERAGLVRQFAGNWYIVNTIDPDVEVLAAHLNGIHAFYRFLHDRKLISPIFLKLVEKECTDTAFYADRIESFWDLKGDGYFAWEKKCTLKDE